MAARPTTAVRAALATSSGPAQHTRASAHRSTGGCFSSNHQNTAGLRGDDAAGGAVQGLRAGPIAFRDEVAKRTADLNRSSVAGHVAGRGGSSRPVTPG